MNHRTLQPLTSQTYDHPAAGICAGDVIQDQHFIDASVQLRYREHLHQVDLASDTEVVAAEKRKIGLLLDANFPIPVGPDLARTLLDRMDVNQTAIEGLTQAVKTMDERLNSVEGTVKKMDERLNSVEGTVKTMDERLNSVEGTVKENQAAIGKLTQTVVRMEGRMIPMSIQIAKSTNRNLGPQDAIVPVPNLCGEFPPEHLFPRTSSTYTQIASEMPENTVNELLQFYGVDYPQNMLLDEKKSLLCYHLGLVPLAQMI
jgi:hypothetical protein